ncbi:hypothetical protein [Neisseria dentiae]|uniref:hypothetical protein n=1 Tax=Neisseria dentiae TaxID=194197 RepID=UPI0035A0E2FF
MEKILNQNMPVKELSRIELINSLQSYLDRQISGKNLLELWEQSSQDFQPIYYNLFHLVCDEDIRLKDDEYSKRQIQQLELLIEGMKKNESIDILKEISFL